jgi:hypothetical protein
MANIAISGIFGFVALILSYGFFVPTDLNFLNVIGAAGSMAGYLLGQRTVKQRSIKNVHVWMVALLSILICASCAIGYHLLVHRASGEATELVGLAFLLLGVFSSLSFLIAFAGVSIKK